LLSFDLIFYCFHTVLYGNVFPFKNPYNIYSIAIGLSKPVAKPAPLTDTKVNPSNSQTKPPT
jgi:hypothetical protein